MKAKDIMTVGATTVVESATLAEAARLMLASGVSGLPVVSAEGLLVGILTEGDVLRRSELDAERRRPRWLEFFINPGALADDYVHAHSRRVADVMTPDVVTIAADVSVAEVARLMERHRVKRLPVVEDERVIGIVSRANLLRALAAQLERPAETNADNAAVRQRILDEIDGSAWASSATVDVVVRDGTVELNGSVTDERVRAAIRVAAESAAGGREVVNNLRVIIVEPILS